ncbi:MAG TPA: MerR family transcriptional regulator [Gemmatimonadaceae bacterium]|nr:MerR family transcriptional regulator [Gemmatimonadaceae bacterium]
MTLDPTPTYDLGELCELADVTPRTVRYYLQQGLLPSPGRQGPGTRYDRGHLDRLWLIKRLQREHLPLAEIRHRLDALDDDAVRALVEQPPPEPPAPAARDGSAIAYIREVLAGARSPATLQAPAAASAAPAMAPRLKREALAPSAERAEPPPAPPPAGRSTWERITLAPDVELHVRRPLTRTQGKLVDRLVAEARTLFEENR